VTQEWWFDFSGGKRPFSTPKATRPALGHIWPPMQLVIWEEEALVVHKVVETWI